MKRFPEYAVIRENVFKTQGILPVGAFFKNGQIVPGWDSMTERTAPVIPEISVMLYSKVGGGILAGTNDGRIYIGKSGTELNLMWSDGGDTPFIIELYDGAERAVLISGNTFTTISGVDILHAGFSTKLSAGVMRCGRLFGADAEMPYTLRWTGPRGFTDWRPSVAGSLILEPAGGKITNLFNFEDRLVVFRERSIMRFSTYGDPENFRELDSVAIPETVGKTAAIAGDSILFFSNGGLMRYRGGKVTKVEGLLSEDLTSAVTAYVHDGRYYFISGTSKALDKPVIYVYDFIDDCYEILNAEAHLIACDAGTVWAYSKYFAYSILQNGNRMAYEVSAGKLKFGTDGRKIATLLEVDCGEDVVISISNGTRTKDYRNVIGRRRINLRGTGFTVKFTGTSAVKSAYLTAKVIK